MIRSMTGYGSAEADLSGLRLTAQIQSLNHRYCELSVRLPRSLSQFENPVRAFLSKRFTRGKIVLQVGWEGRDEPGRKLKLDRERIAEYVDEIKKLKKETGVKGGIDLPTLLSLPDVWVNETEKPEESDTWTVLEQLAGEASDDLSSMREREGEALAIELEERLTSLQSLVKTAEERNAGRPSEVKEKLLARLKPLLEGVDVDPSRLAQEAALLADRFDFTEECVRLRAHIDQFRSLASSPEPAGRKLNFLLQEMNREANTIGSKCNDADLAGLVVELKNELEKMREQVQNVE
jgi:uncharacterized protein (TIGR00255 family)